MLCRTSTLTTCSCLQYGFMRVAHTHTGCHLVPLGASLCGVHGSLWEDCTVVCLILLDGPVLLFYASLLLLPPHHMPLPPTSATPHTHLPHTHLHTTPPHLHTHPHTLHTPCTPHTCHHTTPTPNPPHRLHSNRRRWGRGRCCSCPVNLLPVKRCWAWHGRQLASGKRISPFLVCSYQYMPPSSSLYRGAGKLWHEQNWRQAGTRQGKMRRQQADKQLCIREHSAT